LKVDLDFKESVHGTIKVQFFLIKTVNYQKKGVCSTCNGSKSKPGTQPQKCGTCQGSGFMTLRQGPMVMKMPCQTCHGEGKKIVHPCTPCKGSGVETKPAK